MNAIAYAALALAAEYYGIPVSTAASVRRSKTAVRARFAAWSAIRTIYGWSYEEIAREFRFHHTAVIYGVDAIRTQDPRAAEYVAAEALSVALGHAGGGNGSDGPALPAAVNVAEKQAPRDVPANHGAAGAGVYDLVGAGDSAYGRVEVSQQPVRRLARKSAPRAIESAGADTPAGLRIGPFGTGKKAFEEILTKYR